MSQILCVTGMHRSGTSLVASWLEQAGLTLHNGRVLGPDVGNPKGHYEDLEFVYLHIGAINYRYPEALGWKVTRPKPLHFTKKQQQMAVEIMDSRSEQFESWGWKDPRTVLFLQQWKELMSHLKTLIVWRPCTQVMDSLLRRSHLVESPYGKTTALESARMWSAHNRLICEYKLKHKEDAILISLEQFIREREIVSSTLMDEWGITLKDTSLDHLFDPTLLQRNRPTLKLRILSLLTGCVQQESLLRELSLKTKNGS